MNKEIKTISRRSVGKVSTVERGKRFGFSWKKVFMDGVFVIFCVLVLALGLHGLPGNPMPKELNSEHWTVDGPFESSNDRGRYALLYSVVEDRSFQFSVELARFAAPDLAYTAKREYVSLFAPGVAFLTMPGYFIGKHFGVAQVGTFSVVAFFGVCNALLIREVGRRIGAHPVASTLAALTFLFATPAFAYATTLSQRHISTLLILLGVYLLVRFNSVFSMIAIWVLCGISVAVDYPNFFMMLPIGTVAFCRVFGVKKDVNSVAVSVRIVRLFSLVFLAVPLMFFLLYNNYANGSPLQISGTLERVNTIGKSGKPVFERELIVEKKEVDNLPEKKSIGFFQSRILMDGFFVHFLSPDRGIVIFTPVILLGFVGLVMAVRKKQPYVALLLAVMGFNILLYSMWDDPYGGWAFGSRYLIPSYAILALFLSLFLTMVRKKNVYLFIFLALFCYSAAVNALGAVTSINNPPKVEADVIAHKSGKVVEYTYMRNFNRLNSDELDSFVFQVVKKYVSSWDYFMGVTLIITILGGCLVIGLRGSRKEVNL